MQEIDFEIIRGSRREPRKIVDTRSRRYRVPKGYKKCPTCGGNVRLPCILCSLEHHA